MRFHIPQCSQHPKISNALSGFVLGSSVYRGAAPQATEVFSPVKCAELAGLSDEEQMGRMIFVVACSLAVLSFWSSGSGREGY